MKMYHMNVSAHNNFQNYIIYMKNLRYHFPTCYAYSVKEPIGELNLKRALDEDTGVFSFFFSLFPLIPLFIFFSTGSDSRFWEFHPSSVILGVFVFFFVLIFCESLAQLGYYVSEHTNPTYLCGILIIH